MQHHKSVYVKNMLFYGFLGFIAFICLMPIIIMFVTSFKTKTAILSDYSFFFFIPTLSNYTQILHDSDRIHYLANSLYVGVISTLVTLFIGSMAAYGLVKWNFYGRNAIAFSTLLVRMIPPAVMTVPIFLIWTFQFELSNSLNGLIFVYVAMNLPFVMWILQSFIMQIPKQLDEAARIDGANEWQIFTKIVLPIIKPGLAAAAIFVFRIVWNEFILALILTNHETRTMPVNISLLNGSHNTDWGQIMALGVLIAIPPLIFTFIASRQIIAGMTAGSVKG
ncbi:MAG: multiple sugar transport system permease protein [Alphaproteobacteria bacterium]|jgi:multiple sugar transport system permease protein